MSEGHSVCVFQALIYESSGKNLTIELFDEDTDKDDFLGWYRCAASHTYGSFMNLSSSLFRSGLSV